MWIIFKSHAILILLSGVHDVDVIYIVQSKGYSWVTAGSVDR